MEEVRCKVHDGHAFSVVEAGALAMLRLYYECQQCPERDACVTFEQLQSSAKKSSE
jgi:hypothetical protein